MSAPGFQRPRARSAAASASQAAARPAASPIQQVAASEQERKPATRPNKDMSSPAILTLVRNTAVLVCLVAAVISAAVMGWTHQGLGDIKVGTQQVLRLAAVKSGVLRADAIATNGLVQGTGEPAAATQEYQAALQEAGQLVVSASVGSDQAELARLNGLLIQYGALLGGGHAAFGPDAASGLASMDEAGQMLRDQIIPILDALIASNQAQVDAARAANRYWAIPIAVVPVLVALWGSYVTATRTRRVLNLGLVVALLAAIGLWQVVDQNLRDTGRMVDSARAGTLQTALLNAEAASAVADAKAWEGRMLLRPETAATNAANFDAAMALANKSVQALSDTTAAAQLASYQQAHDQLMAAAVSGDAALIAAAAGQAGGVNDTFRDVSTTLRANAELAGVAIEQDMAAQQSSLVTAGVLALLLGMAGAIATAAGLGRRIKEYR